jgi:hypothetical protein
MRLAALAGGVLALGCTGAAAAQTPDTVIDSKANPAAAAQALNDGCADMADCDWKSDGKVTNPYGPERVIGDVLYNCSAAGEARTAVGVSDERGESTSVSESVSLDVSLGFLDLEKQSVEFKLFSSQSQSFSTQVSVSNNVPVPPGYKGWTQAAVLSAGVTGSAYITQGIHLIQVENIDLQFPGYQNPGSGATRAQVVYSGVSTPMSQQDLDTRCGALPASSAARAAARAGRPKVRPERFKLTVCSRHAGCARRAVTGMKKPPPGLRGVTAKLMRGGRVYAADNARSGGVRLTQRRAITPGRYRLVMRKKPKRMIVRDEHGKRLHRARQHMITIVPITVRWTRGT